MGDVSAVTPFTVFENIFLELLCIRCGSAWAGRTGCQTPSNCKMPSRDSGARCGLSGQGSAALAYVSVTQSHQSRIRADLDADTISERWRQYDRSAR
jgi:hypothetical protein